MAASIPAEAGHLAEAGKSLRRVIRLAHQVNAPPVLLEGLLGIAALLVQEGRPEPAARLPYFVAHHPACTGDLHPDLERLQVAVADVPPEGKPPTLEEALTLAASLPVSAGEEERKE